MFRVRSVTICAWIGLGMIRGGFRIIRRIIEALDVDRRGAMTGWRCTGGVILGFCRSLEYHRFGAFKKVLGFSSE